MRLRNSVNFLLLISGLSCLVIFGYGLKNIGNSGGTGVFLLFVIVPFLTGLFLLLSLKLSLTVRTNIVVMLLSAGICLYGAQIFIMVWRKDRQDVVQESAEKNDRRFDGRTMLEMVKALRSRGLKAYPMTTGALWLKPDASGKIQSNLRLGKKPFLPLGGVSNAKIVQCNESGEWVIHNSDEHGFRNPKGIWSIPDIEIITLGDSFTFGDCVPEGENVVSRIRKVYPKTLNLAFSGGGPLFQVAYLREYVQKLKPRIVLWFFYEGNDMWNLHLEKRVPLLLRYFGEASFNQGLVSIQDQIDKSIDEFVAGVLKDYKKPNAGLEKTLLDVLFLRDLRTFLRLPTFSWRYKKNIEDLDFGLLEKAVEKINNHIESWGGELYIIYLPSWYRQRRPDHASPVVEKIRREMGRIVSKHKIPFVDMIPVFMAYPAPRKLVVFPGSHYNAKGYRLVAETVLNALQKRRTKRPALFTD